MTRNVHNQGDSVFFPRRPRLRRSLVAAVAAGSSILLVAPAASADDVPVGSTVVGKVVRAYVEHKDEHDAGAATDFGAPLTFVRSSSGAPVRVPTQALKDVPLGATVSVKVGGDVKDAPATHDALDPAKQVLAASVVAPPSPAPAAGSTAASGPAPTDTVSIAMVTPPGTAPDGTTLATVVSEVAGPVTQFWASQSNGAIQLAVGDTHNWGTTTVTTDCSDPEALWAQVAQQVGFVPGAGKHLLVYLPHTSPGCSYGLAEVGSSLHSGGYLYVTDTPTSLVAHELGHNFGLLHSGRTECQGAMETGTCATQEYGDLYDVMASSWQQVGSLNAVQSARLGFLPSTQLQSVTASDVGGTFSLAPLSASSGIRAIRLTSASGSEYYLEYRSATGQDAYLGDPAADWPGLPTGVLLHRVQESDPADSSMLLDGTPTPSSGYANDANDVLPVGAQVGVAGGAFLVSVVGTPGAAATVRVATAAWASLMSAGGSAIYARYQALGGSGGALGAPLSPAWCGLLDGGCYQAFASGLIYWSPASGAWSVSGAVLAKWGATGREWGLLGYPVTDTWCGLVNGGCFQHFEHGSIYSSPAGSYVVRGAIRDKWSALGWETSPLGYPRMDPYCGLTQGGCYQVFEGGSVYFTAATGSHVVTGAIRDKWGTTGNEWGPLGYPLSDTACGLVNSGCYQVFQNGSIYTSPGSGVHLITGPIRDKWGTTGNEWGSLGYPTSDGWCGLANGGCYQTFLNGSIYTSQAGGVHVVAGALRDAWGALGWERGPLGYPVNDGYCGLRNTGCYQIFQYGSLYWTSATGGHLVRGAIRDRWGATGWEGGPLGYPTTDEYCGLRAGGCFEHFEHGSIYYTATLGAHSVTGPIHDAWAAQGWETGRWGYPTTEPATTGTTTTQHFQGGTATYDTTTGQVTFQ